MSKQQSEQFPHAPHIGKSGHEFRIDNNGTAVHFTFGAVATAITGAEAKELRDWLNSCELRTDEEAAELEPRAHEVTGGVAHAPGDENIPDGVVRGQNEHEIKDAIRKNPHPDIGKPPKGK
jgi:hypothetical protein